MQTILENKVVPKREVKEENWTNSAEINLSKGVLGTIMLEGDLFTFYDVHVKDISYIPYCI